MVEQVDTDKPKGAEPCRLVDQAFARFAECVAAPVMLLTPDARIRCANTAFVRTMGLQTEHFLHQSFPSHWLTQPTEALPRWRALLHEAAQGDACTPPVRLSMRSTDGTEIEMQVHATPWSGPSDSVPDLIVATFLPVHDTKEHQRESAERSEHFEGVVEATPGSLFTLDPAGNLLSVNELWLRRFGYDAQEIIGTPAIDRVCPESHAAYHETLQTVRAGEPMENLLFRVTAKTGESINLLVNLTPVFDRAGKLIQILGTGGNVLQLKQIQSELKRSEERLKILFQHAPYGCYLCDLQGRFLDVNRATALISGHTREELIGASILEIGLVPESQRSQVTALLSTAAAGQPLPATEFKVCRTDGKEGMVEITGHPVTIDGQTLLLGAARDITERMRNEENLKESLSLVRATLESTADGIVVLDTQGKIKDFNEQFQELWRLPSDILATRDGKRALTASLAELVDPEAFLATARALHDRPEQEDHGTLHFRDGRVVEYYLKPQSLGDHIVGRVWSFRDVTRAYRAQQEQERLLEQVAAINEELRHFAYVVSHDLKAPLRGIKLLTEWLCTDYSDRLGDDAQENLALLQNRVRRMYNLIEGVLQYSRVGRIYENHTRVNLNAVLTSIIDTIAPPDHIAITVEGTLPTIECEKTRIVQVFQNLLTNAVKYMDKADGRIVVAHQDAGDAWQFSVSDNGPGIEACHFERVFKIFQTLTSRDEFESTGVGLTLVKKIVELYGGEIWIESELGQGATFHFTLPKHIETGRGETPAADVVSDGQCLQTIGAGAPDDGTIS